MKYHGRNGAAHPGAQATQSTQGSFLHGLDNVGFISFAGANEANEGALNKAKSSMPFFSPHEAVNPINRAR